MLICACFSESSQNFIAWSNFFFTSTLPEWQQCFSPEIFERPIKKKRTYQNSGHWTDGCLVTQTSALSMRSWTGADCLLERFTPPFLTVEVDIARTQPILCLTEWKVSGQRVIFFSPWMVNTLPNSLLPRYCEARLQLRQERLQNRVFLLCINAFILDPVPAVCHEFRLTEPSGKPSWSLISLQSKPLRPNMTTVVWKVIFVIFFCLHFKNQEKKPEGFSIGNFFFTSLFNQFSV